jgi:hypothetical protein
MTSLLLAFIAGGAALIATTAALVGVVLFLDDRRGPRETYMTTAWLRAMHYSTNKSESLARWERAT